VSRAPKRSELRALPAPTRSGADPGLGTRSFVLPAASCYRDSLPRWPSHRPRSHSKRLSSGTVGQRCHLGPHPRTPRGLCPVLRQPPISRRKPSSAIPAPVFGRSACFQWTVLLTAGAAHESRLAATIPRPSNAVVAPTSANDEWPASRAIRADYEDDRGFSRAPPSRDWASARGGNRPARLSRPLLSKRSHLSASSPC
jgi:hypothetical protein